MRLRRVCRGIWNGAERRHVSRAKLTPVRKNRRKGGPNFTRSELEKTVTGTPRESIVQSPGDTGLQSGAFVRGTQSETTVRTKYGGKETRIHQRRQRMKSSRDCQGALDAVCGDLSKTERLRATVLRGCKTRPQYR